MVTPWYAKAISWQALLLLAVSVLAGCGGGAGSLPGSPTPSPGAPSVSITSDKGTVLPNEAATLSWSSTQATTVTIDNGIGTVDPTGSRQVQPTADTTYTITATGPGGSASGAVTVKVSDTRSPVKHVIVIQMQNRSFDHLFGKFPGAEGAQTGDPGFVQKDAAGVDVSPFLLTQLNNIDLAHAHANYVKMVNGGQMNQFALVNGAVAMGFYDNTTPGIGDLWALAQQFALADNFFASVLGDAPTNQLYMVAASDNNFPFGVEPAFGPCQLSDPEAKPFTFRNVGDQLTAKKIDWAWFAEGLGNCGSYEPNQNPFQYFTSTHDSGKIQAFSAFQTKLTNGTLPPVSFVQPSNPNAMHPSSSANITVGAQWLVTLVQQIQNSSAWPETAIIVLWDSSGGWYDHVPPPSADSQGFGPRVPLLVISPFGKRNYISHVQMDDVSILKFIQWNWGLGSLNPRNDSAASGDIRDMFSF